MSIVQKFYDSMASHYDKLFLDWESTTKEQAELLNRLFREKGFATSSSILDCACGIGTQAIGLARMGYDVTASDISDGELSEAKKEQRKTESASASKKLISVLCRISSIKNSTSLSLWIMHYRICLQKRI